MIERKFVSQNIKEFEVKKYLFDELTRAGLSDVKVKRTPLGEKVLIYASRPGLVVGKGGSNITRLTNILKKDFGLESPQIEIEEVSDPGADAAITAALIANSLERFGSARFKGVGHKALASVMQSGALGVEILISGKIPSSRAKTWRFYEGYLKKCGDISITGVDKAHQIARLKTGVVGITVTIMPGSTQLPDRIELRDEPETIVEEASEEEAERKAEEAKEQQEEKDKSSASKSTEKTAKKTEKKSEEKAKPTKSSASKSTEKTAKKTEKKSNTTKTKKSTTKKSENKDESKDSEK